MAIRNLKGKRVFITGAASGIGAATAEAFAREGCELLLADLNTGGLNGTMQSIRQLGAESTSISLDVSNEEQFHQVAGDIIANSGVPHVVINNAGIGAHGSFLNTPMDVVRRVIDINLYGVYNGCHAFLPAMLEAGEPCHLVNVASLASISPMPNMSAYAASKYAVDGLTEVLAMEMSGSNVDVTCVHPGIINTPIAEGQSYNGDEGRRQEQHLGEYYQAHGSDPAVVARDIVKAVKQGRAHLWTGNKAPLTEKVKRLSPALMRRMAMKMARTIGYA
ncbi:MAG: SDR family NAD(P)-dependent oxidoreductase [Haliea sp.]|jgi:NAD(P)-dependent dehydrogenase (short-subunit alcohol dehydrogenase family)|nr:SDR family NAD(P)-dependent oxidoreductase [Haliea sp.]